MGVLRDTARAPQPPTDPPTGHRLPVTALALSARRPFGHARFARGLDKTVLSELVTL